MNDDQTRKHYTIAFIPDSDTTARAIAVSQAFRAYATDPDFVLGLKRNIPHLSLFHLMLDAGSTARCGVQLQRIVDELGPLPAGAFPAPLMEVVQRGGTLFWEASCTDVIMTWHEKVLELCEPLRKGKVMPSYRPKGRRAEALERYGYVYARRTYSPHITLQRLKDRRRRSCSPRAAYQWRPAELVLARVNDLGVITHPDFAASISL